MRILHTSDWHLGHRLHEQSQYEEQINFLEWLEKYISESKIDILLVAGDIFDTGTPSTQSQKMYYDFLISLTKTNCKHIIITGGNHDAPGTINAPKELLNALSIKVVGKAHENISDEVFELIVNDEKIIIGAVPYLRDQDIRRAVAGESFDDISEKYKSALINHYKDVAEYCETIKDKDTLVFAMGHLFAIGGTTTPNSEQTLYVGGLGDIGASDFPDTFDYIALGHLHRPQKVGGENNIRYSGSPNILSFSEINYEKNVITIETDSNNISNIKEIVVPRFRHFFKVTGNIEDSISELNNIDKKQLSPTPWVEVVLDNQNGIVTGATEINEASENLNLKVLKVTLKEDKEFEGLKKLANNYTNVKELSPIEVFERKCEENEFDLNENQEILDAFNEILQIAREN